MGIWNFLKFISPPEASASDKSVQSWRFIVSFGLVVLVIFISWSLGLLFNFSGFAFAADVDTKVLAATAPINDRLKAIESEQTIQGGYLKTLVSNDFARLIRSELRARCKATSSEEKTRINAAIDTYQKGYKNAAGDNYNEPDCEDL